MREQAWHNRSHGREVTFEDGGSPFHVVLVPADPPELGGALACGGLVQGTGLHCHSQPCPGCTGHMPGAGPTGPSPPLTTSLWFHCTAT